MNATLECPLCKRNFSSRNKLLAHERNKHRSNKVVPHRASLFLPSLELLIYYQDAFIVLIKKRLGFNRHSIGFKRLSISAFPETIFVHLFESEPTFRYSPVQRKYYCQFQGKEGEERLKQILNYEHWSFRQDPETKTTGYVLFVNYEGTYKVNFSWTLTELNENQRNFQCGAVTCTFVADSGEFVNENRSEANKSLSTNWTLHTHNHRFILPRTPLQQLHINNATIINKKL